MTLMDRWSASVLGAVVVFVAVSRAALWSPHPDHYDFANFALAVERFDPVEHRPHPPGYPLLILTAKALAMAGLPVMAALQVTGLAGSLAAVLGAFWLGRRLAGERGGIQAAFLLAVEPVFWYSGLNSPVRSYLAAGVCWLLYCLVELAGGRRSMAWMAAALVALFSGFRPEVAPFFAVPFVVAARMGGFGWRDAAKAAGLCAALCLPWLAWIVSAYPSPYEFARIQYYYFLFHASTSSALLGAPPGAWQSMLQNTLLWNGVPAVAAVAALRGRPIDSRFYLIAAAFFLPALAVQLGVHLGYDAPDHALGTIAALVVFAGARLAAPAVAILAAASILLVSLAAPGSRPPEIDRLSLRAWVRHQQSVDGMLRGLRQAMRPQDALVVTDDSPLGARLLQFEFPRHLVFSLDSTLGSQSPPAGWRFAGPRQTPLDPAGIPLTSVRRLHFVAGPQRKLIQERLCGQLACEEHPEALQVDLRRATGPLDLPPYRLLPLPDK